MGAIFTKLLDAFYNKKLEVVLVGLENSGKTTLLNVLAAGRPVETCPTIGLNVKLVRKGGVQMKCWDIGGQAQYRSEWGRYTRGCDVIIYVVDANALDSIPLARKELHRLLEDRELATTPLLVIANKIDLDPHISEPDLIRELNLDYITENPWIVIPVSALKVINIDQVLSWLIKQGSATK
jgi:Arf/Sar family protein